MQRKIGSYQNIKGMNQDLVISKFSPEFIYYGYNIRLDSVEDNTLMSISNERGNKKAVIINGRNGNEIEIEGSCVGYCVIDQYLVLFTAAYEFAGHEDPPYNTKPVYKWINYIYRIEKKEDAEDTYISYMLTNDPFGTELNITTDHLVECFGVKESDSIIKVYWTDGVSQLRVINIANINDTDEQYPRNNYSPNELNF